MARDASYALFGATIEEMDTPDLIAMALDTPLDSTELEIVNDELDFRGVDLDRIYGDDDD